MKKTLLKQGLVTIAIPAYKQIYLKEAIESALMQDYPHIELIIVNDHSPYNLDIIVHTYNDNRIRYYVNETNLGKSSIVHNWNKCLSLAQGEFFILLCDDDVLRSNFVSDLLQLAKKYPNCNVFHSRKINLHKDGREEKSPLWPEFENATTFLKNRLAKKRHHTITEFMYRTAAIQEKKYIVFPKGFYSDNASIINFTQDGGIASSKQALAVFRYSDEHISSNASLENCIGKTQDALQYWKWIHQFEIAKEYKQQIREEVQCTIYYSFISAPIIGKLLIMRMTPYKIFSIKERIAATYQIFCKK